MIAWLRAHRALRIILMATLFPVPIANLLSAVLPAFIGQVSGWRQGLIDVLAALALLGGLVVLSGGNGWLAVAAGAVLWGTALLGGDLVGRFRSMTLACQVLVMISAGGFLLADALLPPARAFWLPKLSELVRNAGLPDGSAVQPADLAPVADLMNGLLAVGGLNIAILSLVLGSSLAGAGEGPGSGAMFRQIAMGRVLAVVALLVAGAALLAPGPTWQGLLLVLGSAFVLQGLAIVHWHGAHRRWPAAWPLVLYVPMLLSPTISGAEVLGLALLGFADNWVALRRAARDVV